ncbi:lysine N(6)-hydroxylase/L-ornithine N(5)-oxygenase family protein [Cyanobacterium aponinum]|uniref:lysine N(6)-hydroxylase/L-ornithine N(5)-oxygenase family protein n=1 Tax=Cyanobacterium aponinum TaxID=379064 RepID=UPI000C12A79F|nr:lysine N(6)-hydroxylase/L-ornithine N(5)-oxygenase family protein [Cyanobacterium aponinum]PHV64131.1 lysine 6-monooxygenase [Cyanobacterium aponinum IPPAS B-1201]
MTEKIYDLLGVGIGPFNLSLAALIEPISHLETIFLEQKTEFQWHEGLLMEGTTIQVPFLADLVTMADPCSRFTFLNYLREHSRLYNFYFLEEFKIYRREYNHYCQWVSQQLKSCRFSEKVESITWHEGGYFIVQSKNVLTSETSSYKAKNLVLGVGTTPAMPPCFKNFQSQENIFHSAEFLHKQNQYQTAKSVTVIGSGQSAAEVFYQLLQDQEKYHYHLEWHTRSSGFFPMEYSKLGLEHFSPDYIKYFYHLPQEKRDQIRSRQNLLYKGISFSLIADIYNLLYERSIGQKALNVRLRPLLEVKEVEQTEMGYRLSYRHCQEDAYVSHDTDCIVLATGYQHFIPSFMDGLNSLIQWDSQHRYGVNFDYRLQLTKNIPNSIFVQNGELHTHGIGTPDLGLGAHRSSVIINTLLGEEIYPVSSQNVFQEFGVAE